MKYIDWKYFEDMNDSVVNEVIAKCRDFGLRQIMAFKYNWNTEIICQFYASYYYRASDNTIHWTTEGEHYFIDYMTFSRLLGLDSKDEARDPIHVERKLKPDRCSFMFYNPVVVWEGKTKNLLPYYYYANFMLRWTIDPKKGDSGSLHVFAVNLMNQFAPGGRPFNVFNYIWNELRRVMDDSRKHLPYAPYIMYMIERITKITFPKDVKHEALHIRSRDADAPPSSTRHRGSSSSAPMMDDPPIRLSHRRV